MQAPTTRTRTRDSGPSSPPRSAGGIVVPLSSSQCAQSAGHPGYSIAIRSTHFQTLRSERSRDRMLSQGMSIRVRRTSFPVPSTSDQVLRTQLWRSSAAPVDSLRWKSTTAGASRPSAPKADVRITRSARGDHGRSPGCHSRRGGTLYLHEQTQADLL